MSARDEINRVASPPPAVVVSETLVADMAGRLPAQSKEMVQEHFGISFNTWLKIKKGQPIRRSTAELLLHRLRLQERPGM